MIDRAQRTTCIMMAALICAQLLYGCVVWGCCVLFFGACARCDGGGFGRRSVISHLPSCFFLARCINHHHRLCSTGSPTNMHGKILFFNCVRLKTFGTSICDDADCMGMQPPLCFSFFLRAAHIFLLNLIRFKSIVDSCTINHGEGWDGVGSVGEFVQPNYVQWDF